MRKLLLLAAIVSVAVPATALAAKPPHPAQAKNLSHAVVPQVLYVLSGKLTAYTAASGSTNGSVSITVSAANHSRATLKGMTLTFPVSAATKVVLHRHAAIAANDRGIVKVRGARTLDVTALQAAVAKQVIDQGAAKT
jgi:hypothetical protein